MDPVFAISTYIVVWWTVLFAVLPLGSRSHAQAGIEVPGGGDPASPVEPNLRRKFITTTWVSAIVWIVAAVALRVFGPSLQPPGV